MNRRPNPTLAQQQAETLHKAARGMGTDETPLSWCWQEFARAEHRHAHGLREQIWPVARQPHYEGDVR